VSDSDGAAVTNVALGPDFKRGLLVVHDGDNTPVALDGLGDPRPQTDFKFVRWQDVAGNTVPRLMITPTDYRPWR